MLEWPSGKESGTLGIRGSIAVVVVLWGWCLTGCNEGTIVGAGPGGVCGDGLSEFPEECDDGNTADGDGCSAGCRVEQPPTSVCGDGLVDDGEACDDGNTDNDDGCSVYCQVEAGFECAGEPSVCTGTCGNAILEYYEQCDDGNLAGGDGCSELCRVEEGYTCEGMPSLCEAICGDGLILGDEECDDGNLGSNDGCGGTCLLEPGFVCAGEPTHCETICGDGLAVGDETCDGAGETATCDVDCTAVACGDGVLNLAAGEQCDDGNNIDCDGCSALCTSESPSVCGDGLVGCGETCDDGNTVGGDGCGPACLLEQCGDGILQSGELCDDGGESATCDADCTPVSCGDSTVNAVAGEQCDDGNATAGDGCDAQCVLECDPLVNLAAQPGVSAASSGGGALPLYGPERMNDGHGHADCDAFKAHWVAAQDQPGNAWVRLAWPNPVLIARIVVDTVNAYSADCIGVLTGRSLSGAAVQWWDGTSYVTDGTTSGHVDDWVYQFTTPVLTTAIRLYGVHSCDVSLCPAVDVYTNPIVIELEAYCM